jgi:DNA repair protein RadC
MLFCYLKIKLTQTMNQNISIKSWAEDDRPREKMILKGRHVLSDTELLAILLGSGTRDKSAVELAQEILSSCSNDLSEFGKFSFHELVKFNGVGMAKAVTILAALELGRRRKDSQPQKRLKITSSQHAFDLMETYFKDLIQEEFYIILLNRSNEVIKTQHISKGGFSGTIADGKVIFKYALENAANGIILCHNHPSGNVKPSDADLRLTKKMCEFGQMIDLPVLDHLIFGDNNYLSLADHGLMK